MIETFSKKKFYGETSLLILMLFILILSMLGFGMYFKYQSIVTYIIIPGIFLFGVLLNRFRFPSFLNYYNIVFLLILALYILFFPFSIKPGYAIKIFIRAFGVWLIMLMTIEVISYNPKIIIKWIMISYLIGFFANTLYIFPELISRFGTSGEFFSRRGLGLNANKYSYFSYFANIAAGYLILIGNRKKLFIVVSIGTMFWSSFVAFSTASRSGLLFVVLVTVGFWLFVYARSQKYKNIRLILVMGLILLGSNKLMTVYNDSYLKTRVERSDDDEPRLELVKEAINVFLDYPITGVGPGQFIFYSKRSQFSHNSYTEMAANMGVLGLMLLLILFIRPGISSLREFKSRNPSINRNLERMNLLFFLTFIIYNNFYIFYDTIYGMMFFMTIIAIQNYNRKNPEIFEG